MRKKVNTTGADEILFRLVSVPGHGARVLPLELVPGAQICARAPTKGYVQTGARAREPSLNRALDVTDSHGKFGEHVRSVKL